MKDAQHRKENPNLGITARGGYFYPATSGYFYSAIDSKGIYTPAVVGSIPSAPTNVFAAHSSE
jgi:hypothetical protein